MESLTKRSSLTDRDLYSRYRLLERLGAGGMSEVFLGIQHGAKDFNRLVVIKQMLPEVLTVDTLKLLASEARLVATINHPHIVKVFDLVAHDQNLVITMEYVDGETLRLIISSLTNENKKFPLPILCRLIAQTAEALHYAHTATGPDGVPLGLVHQDIDVTNIMVETSGHIKLIDFGVASSALFPDKMLPNIFKGKVTFAAPEVFAYPDTIDHRSDIYSLGVVAFIMATRRNPFQFSSESMRERILKVVTEPLPVPSSIDPEIPEELDAIIARATDKDRDKRFQTAEQFADAIESFANTHDGMATVQEVRRWLFANFAERIAERRNWVRTTITNAYPVNSESNSFEPGAPGDPPALPAPDGFSVPPPAEPAGSVDFNASDRDRAVDPLGNSGPADLVPAVIATSDPVNARIDLEKRRRVGYAIAVAAILIFSPLGWYWGTQAARTPVSAMKRSAQPLRRFAYRSKAAAHNRSDLAVHARVAPAAISPARPILPAAPIGRVFSMYDESDQEQTSISRDVLAAYTYQCVNRYDRIRGDGQSKARGKSDSAARDDAFGTETPRNRENAPPPATSRKNDSSAFKHLAEGIMRDVSSGRSTGIRDDRAKASFGSDRVVLHLITDYEEDGKYQKAVSTAASESSKP
jgi:serine/threonine protein kinase